VPTLVVGGGFTNSRWGTRKRSSAGARRDAAAGGTQWAVVLPEE
jgi:hypothetical protein